MRTSVTRGQFRLTLVVLVTLCALGLCGCGKSSSPATARLDSLTSTQAAKLVREIINDSTTNKPGNHSPLYPMADVTKDARPWKVHVDLSSNMQGYVNPANGSFRPLLERLHKFMPAGSVFQGERSGVSAPESGIEQLLKPGTYVGTGVDYSKLFMSLISEENFAHIFLTDCVLLNNRIPLPPRSITDELKAYLARGGDFTLLVFRMPFRGDYTSVSRIKELPRSAPPEDAVIRDLQTDARPIMLWVFMPPGQSIGNQAGPIGKLAELLDLKPPASLSGESSFGTWQCLFPPSRGKQQFELMANSLSSTCKSNMIRAKGFNDVPWVKFANDSQGVPFRFNVLVPVTSLEGTNRTPAALRDAVDASTQVDVDCWAITDLETWKLARLRPPPKHPIPKPVWTVWTNGAAASTSMASEVYQLDLRLMRPELPEADRTPDKMVLMFTVRPNRSAATGIWKDLLGLSTKNDSSQNAADRIYGLEDVLGLVQTECGVYARTLVFAEWGR